MYKNIHIINKQRKEVIGMAENKVNNEESIKEKVRKLEAENERLKSKLKRAEKKENYIRSKRINVLTTPNLYNAVKQYISDEKGNESKSSKKESMNEFINRAIKDELDLRKDDYISMSELKREMDRIEEDANKQHNNKNCQKYLKMSVNDIRYGEKNLVENYLKALQVVYRSQGVLDTIKALNDAIYSEKE